ncbi:MAG: K+/H+ antiporter subunit F [Gammaproteobacteria bacterium]|jgi:multicomponent K+:H+ antiporter subunit F|nr:K+/H+ antiporter subunit F [Gammaproteobacteria bacterium]
MLTVAIWISMAMIGLAFSLNLVRLMRGPSIVDRVLALDTLYINGLAILVIFGIAIDSRVFFEAALLIALFGFFSTVVISKYLLRGDVIE